MFRGMLVVHFCVIILVRKPSLRRCTEVPVHESRVSSVAMIRGCCLFSSAYQFQLEKLFSFVVLGVLSIIKDILLEKKDLAGKRASADSSQQLVHVICPVGACSLAKKVDGGAPVV